MVEKARTEWDAHPIEEVDARAAGRATYDALAHWCGEVIASAATVAGRDSREASHRLDVRRRLLDTLTSEERFRPFFAELERCFAIDQQDLRAVLRKIDNPASYQDASMPGVRFFHFAPGAGCGFAEAGIVRLAKGAHFPRHEHLGEEVNFILEGSLVEAGVVHGPGSAVTNLAGTAHAYQAGATRDLILVAGHNGVRYLAE
jgi:hypothetical protein